MAEPLKFETYLKIGFVNCLSTYDVGHFTEVFDALVMHDGDMTFLCMLVKAIAGEEFDLVGCSQSLIQAFQVIHRT